MKNVFQLPKPRVCPGQYTKYPIVTHKPIDWIKQGNENYGVTCLDGYVVDATQKITALFRRLEYFSFDDLSEMLKVENYHEYITDDEFQFVISLSTLLNVPFDLFLWPIDYPKDIPLSDKVIVRIDAKISNGLVDLSKHMLFDMDDLKMYIKSLRTKSFSSVKPLSSASSFLECYLANDTADPWPGDLDAIMYNRKNTKQLALLEFKTHNITTPVKDEHIGKYGIQDWRRFSVLFDLQEMLDRKTSTKPKIFFIVWGTTDHANHKQIKIDVLERNKIVKTVMMDRPAFGIFSQGLLDTIIELL